MLWQSTKVRFVNRANWISLVLGLSTSIDDCVEELSAAPYINLETIPFLMDSKKRRPSSS